MTKIQKSIMALTFVLGLGGFWLYAQEAASTPDSTAAASGDKWTQITENNKEIAKNLEEIEKNLNFLKARSMGAAHPH